jgi:hypothetical protein
MKKTKKITLAILTALLVGASVGVVGLTACGENETHVHTIKEEWSTNEEIHYHICTDCLKHFDEEPHAFDELNRCAVCELSLDGYSMDTVIQDGLLYNLNSNGTSYYFLGALDIAISTDIVIASEIKGLPVTSMLSLYQFSYNIVSIVIPDSITEIPEDCFRDIDSLQSVTMGNGITEIGESAFESCDNLTSITMPNNLKKIGSRAFGYCNNLETVNLNEGLEEIGGSAFEACEKLTSITMPNSLKKIGEVAFGYCYNLGTVNLNEGLEEIGAGAFNSCKKLASITMPNNVKKIEQVTFYGCDNLATAILNEELEEIGESAFCGCKNLVEITLPNSINSIGENAFGNTGIKSLVLPDGITSIIPNMFPTGLKNLVIGKGVTTLPQGILGNLKYLESLTIPFVGGSANATASGEDTVFGYIFTKGSDSSDFNSNIYDDVKQFYTDVGYEGEQGNSAPSAIYYIPWSLKSVTVTGGVIWSGAFCNTHLENIILEEGVTEIKNYVFLNCQFTDMVIPDSVTSIGVEAFSQCFALVNLTLGSGVKTLKSRAFFTCLGLENVYYRGTEEQWQGITIEEGSHSNPADNKYATLYYLAETEPTESGNYWHYDVDGVTPIVWNKES